MYFTEQTRILRSFLLLIELMYFDNGGQLSSYAIASIFLFRTQE